MTPAVAAAPVSATYRYMRKPAYVGELRVKTWACLIPPTSDSDPVWAQRCKDYWELQQETYGLKFSNFTMAADCEAGLWYLSTWAVVVGIMPGRRVHGYTAPRVAARG